MRKRSTESVKVKPWGQGQGDYVLVDKADHEANPGKYELFETVAEEPVAEEPVAEEPVAEEPVAEEPVAGKRKGGRNA